MAFRESISPLCVLREKHAQVANEPFLAGSYSPRCPCSCSSHLILSLSSSRLVPLIVLSLSSLSSSRSIRYPSSENSSPNLTPSYSIPSLPLPSWYPWEDKLISMRIQIIRMISTVNSVCRISHPTDTSIGRATQVAELRGAFAAGHVIALNQPVLVGIFLCILRGRGRGRRSNGVFFYGDLY